MPKVRRIERKDLEFDVEPPPEKCPRCDATVVKGSLLVLEWHALNRFAAQAVKVYPEDPTNPEITHPEYSVNAFACTKCGYTELYTNFAKVIHF